MPFESPEPVYASWSRRVAATFLDAALGGGLSFLAFGLTTVGVPFLGTPFPPADARNVPATSWTDSGWIVGAVLLMVAMQAYFGVTPGKLVVGIAVVGEHDARPIGFLRTLARWLAHILDSILLIGYLRPLWNAQRQTFADSIMATLVLETRRPRQHHWFARGGSHGDFSLDPGPPQSWEAPSAPRGWRAATAVSILACGLAVPFSVDSSPGQASGPMEISCEVATADNDQIGLTSGTLRSSSSHTTTTRLGVTRPIRGSDGQVRATWYWNGDLPATRAGTLRISFARTDGTSARQFAYPLPAGTSQQMTIGLPSDALKGLGDSWTWTQTIVVDGVETPGCTATFEGLTF